jgi:hypothetical protein
MAGSFRHRRGTRYVVLSPLREITSRALGSDAEGRREIQGARDALINEILSLSDTADAGLPPLSANYGPI